MAILAATDGERVPSRAVAAGHELARDLGEDLVVMHVMSEDTFDQFRDEAAGGHTVRSLPRELSYRRSGEHRSSYTVEDAKKDAASLARDVVEDTLEDWEHVQFVGRVGDPVKQILGETERRDARYLVVGGRKRTPVGKAVFGSTAQSLLLEADLPVMAVVHERER